MRLTEAILLVQRDIDHPGSVAMETLYEAEQLLLGAGRRIQGRRDLGTGWEKQLLPGETKD